MKYYDQSQINAYVSDIVKGRREFTEEIIAEGLDQQIIKWAEESYKIDKSEERKIVLMDVAKQTSKVGDQELNAVTDNNNGESIYRPPRSLGWRTK